MSQVRAYFNSVLVLLKGSVFAHIITLLSLPILSRLYSQEIFGELAVLISSSAILSIFLPLRLDLAIYNSQSEADEAHTWLAALWVSFVNLLLSYLILIIFELRLTELFNINLLTLYLIPLSAFLLVLFNLNTNYSIALEKYDTVKNVKIFRSALLATSQISLSFISTGLILGEMIGRGGGVWQLYRSFKHKIAKHIKSLEIKEQLKRHSGFIKFSVIGGISNSTSIQLPSLFFASQYGLQLAGVYLITNRLAAIPIALIGQSMQQVFSSKFSKLSTNDERLNLVYSVVFRSMCVSLCFFGTFWLTLPFVVPLFFGEGWSQVTEFLILLFPMLASQLGIFPITNVLNLLNKQSWSMVWDLTRLLSLILVIFVTVSFRLSGEVFLLTYSLVMSSFYFVLLFLVRRVIKNGK